MGWTFIKYRDFKIIQYVSVGVFIETHRTRRKHREKAVVQTCLSLTIQGKTDFNSLENCLAGDYTISPSSSLNCYITLTVNFCKVKCKSKHF